MRRFKIVRKIIKVCSVCVLILTGLILCGFYTHPSFMEENLEAIWPSSKKSFSFKSLFQPSCDEYESFSLKLNDKQKDYIWNSAYQKFGDVVKVKEEIRPYYLEKKLVLVDSSDVYVVDSLFYSYAFLTPDAKQLLDDIGKRFQEKIQNTTLNKSRILVTSLLRTESTVKRLRKTNRNSIRISSHLHGTTFDLAHNEFRANKVLSQVETMYLKEILAQTLHELRSENRCFVTYEYNQACFHVVNKNTSFVHFENPKKDKTSNL